MKLVNSIESAFALVALAVAENITVIFDLDAVLLDASDRITLYTDQDVQNGICEPDQIGHLDLDKYRINSTPEQIALDKDLPLIAAVQMFNLYGIPYHVSTARVLCAGTKALLQNRGISPLVMMNRRDESDHRRDNVLKIDNLKKHFHADDVSRLLLVDDNIGNCRAFVDVGAMAMHVIN